MGIFFFFFFRTIQKAYIGRYKRIRYNLDIMRHTARLVVNPITVKIIGYNLDIMRQTACLVVNPITIVNPITLELHDGGSGLRLNDVLFLKFSQMGWGLMLCLCLDPPWFSYWFSLALAGSVCMISQGYSSLFLNSD